METAENAFAESIKRKRKQKRVRTIVALCVTAVVIIVGVVILRNALNTGSESASTLAYNVTAVASGEISATISGSGTLTANRSQSVTAAANATVLSVEKQPGDAVEEGETVLTLESDELSSQLESLYDELDTIRTKLSAAKQFLTSLSVTAPKAGIVKDVVAREGDVVDNMTYLCLIATDGKMRVQIPAGEGVGAYDAVVVSINGEEQQGYVIELSDGTATISFADNYYAVGTSASVYSTSGALLGSGAITVNEHVLVTTDAGRIETVTATDNLKVVKGKTLFTLAEGAPTSAYASYRESEADLLSQIADLENQLTIKAEYDCVLTSISVKAGDEITAGGSLCTLSGTDGYTMTLSIDELDISSVALGQTAAITLDALEGEYTGSVTNISYAGSGSYVTSYTATVTTEPIEGAYPGMSASVEIITATSGESLIVPVAAIQYEGDATFVYLAGDDASAGSSVAASDVNLDQLEKVYVTVGMSDGTYITITADGLEVGDRVYVTSLTTSAVYTADENTTTAFSFGGFSSDTNGMPSGMPSDMSGGMPSGMGGGNMGGGQRPGN